MAENALEIQSTGRGIMAPLSLLEIEEGFNVRTDTNPDDEFMGSVKAHGVLRPLHVRNNVKHPGHYLIVDGERRFRAAIAADLTEVPIIPEGDMDDASALVMSLVANEGSKPLTIKEEAKAFQRLRSGGVDIAEIARVMGRSKRKVEETLRALESGDEEIVDGLLAENEDERIPPRVAARAVNLPEKTRKEIAPKLKGKNVIEGVKIVRELEKEAGLVRRGRKASEYPWAADAKKRAELLEKAAKQVLKEGVNRRADAHLEIIACLKGKTEPGELYVDIMEAQKTPASKEPKEKVVKKAKKGSKKTTAAKNTRKKKDAA